MALVLSTGVVTTSLSEYIADLGVRWQQALGPDLSLDVETPQGQQISVLSLLFTEVDEAIQALGNAHSLSRAVGSQVDDLGSLLSIERGDATRSTVTVTLTGQSGTVIRDEARASTSAGDFFRLTSAVTIPASGSIDAPMESVEFGPVPADAGALTVIVDLIAGWEGVTNAAAATPGSLSQSDSAYKLRYPRRTSRLSRSSIAAVESNVLEVSDVEDLLVRDNDTTSDVTLQGKIITPRSLYVAVQGGSDADVAQEIADSKGAGQPTVGAVSESVNALDASGDVVDTYTINFDRVVEIPITVTVPVTAQSGFPAEGETRMINALVAEVNGLGISDPVDVNRLIGRLVEVPNHSLGTVVVARVSGAESVVDRSALNLFDRLTLAAADVTINLS